MTTTQEVSSKDGESRAESRPDLAVILARIDTIAKEIRELKTPRFSRNPSRLEEVRLNAVQKGALRVLAEGSEMSAEEVAKAVNRTRSLMVINLNQLVALGLVERERRGRRVYFRQKQPSPSDAIGEELKVGGCYLFTVLVSDSWPEDTADAEHLIAERLKGISDWRIDHMAILPRLLTDDNKSGMSPNT